MEPIKDDHLVRRQTKVIYEYVPLYLNNDQDQNQDYRCNQSPPCKQNNNLIALTNNDDALISASTKYYIVGLVVVIGIIKLINDKKFLFLKN